MTQAKCDNCENVFEEDDLNIPKRLHERLTAGGVVPSGECPICGSLAYPLKGYWFKKEWADDLDGGAKVAAFVNAHVITLVDSDDIEVDTAGDAIDLALAAVMVCSENEKDVLENLDYVIRELQIVRNNISGEVEND